MAKRSSNSRKSLLSSSPLSEDNPSITPNKENGFEDKTAQNSQRELSETDEDERETRPRSSKRSKSTMNKATKAQKKIDGSKPKKPPTAFFYFLEDFRRGYQEENPEVKNMRDVGKACGEKWKTMKYEEKVNYYDIATEKRAEFDRAMADYIRRKESGEDAELEDSDSEFDGE